MQTYQRINKKARLSKPKDQIHMRENAFGHICGHIEANITSIVEMYRITVPSSVLRGMDPSNFEKVGIEIILDYWRVESLNARRICFVYP